MGDNLSKAGWNWGWVSSTDHEVRQFWVVAAERENAGRFIVHAAEKLTAFLELEAAIRGVRPEIRIETKTPISSFSSSRSSV